MARNQKQSDYNAGQIQVLKGLEAVRKRPGMYIGSTGPRGLHHLVYEVVDNSVDEALAGYCDAHRRHDPSRQFGHRQGQRPRHSGGHASDREACRVVEVAMTMLHAGGKFDKDTLQGVGRSARRRRVSVVNALSEWLDGRSPPRRQDLSPALCARRQDHGARGHRQDEGDRHDRSLQAGPRDLHASWTTRSTRCRTGCASSRS